MNQHRKHAGSHAITCIFRKKNYNWLASLADD